MALLVRVPNSSLVVAVSLALAVVPGCTRSPSEVPEAGLAVVDAGPPKPVPLEVRVTGFSVDGGTVALESGAAGERPLIDPVHELTVQANLALVNHRIRVFDEADRALVSDDELLDDGTQPLGYRIRFPEPLRTGHAYDLVVDAQTGATLMDSRGNTHPDVRIGFRITGEKEKPPPPPRKRRR